MLNMECNGGVTSDKCVIQSSLALVVGKRREKTCITVDQTHNPWC